MGEEGDDISGADKLASESAEQKPQTEETKQEKKQEGIPDVKTTEPTTPATPSKDLVQPYKGELPKSDVIFASPIAKKIALERGIPLAKIKGTGPNGRIIREDVEKFQPAAAAAAGPTAGFPTPAAASPDYVDTPVSSMRRTIGMRLTQSKQEVPHYYLTADINMDKVLKLRELFNKTLGEKDKSAKLSVNDFIVKASACALADVPEANSAWLGEVIRT